MKCSVSQWVLETLYFSNEKYLKRFGFGDSGIGVMGLLGLIDVWVETKDTFFSFKIPWNKKLKDQYKSHSG